MEGLCARCLGALNFAPETVLPGEHAAHAPTLTTEELAPHFPQLEIIACLGRGGMGVVYKARQKTLNRLVALKLLAPERANDPQFATRFEKEAQALASLNHPHVVGVYDFGQAGGFFYLLMEFVDGVNLRQAMSAGRFTPEQSLAIVPPVCEALQYAHEHGIVHRDIKPENLLLDKEGRVKIADFGIAKMLGTEADTSARDDEQQAGTLASAAGTPQYMAPEQKAHRTTDHRADIYSLGVVLYELLTGELPTGELPTDKLQPPSRKVQIDVRLDEIVLRALQTQPELRYQTAREFRAQLETVVSTHADSQSSCLFKTGQGFLYPPDQFTTASGQLYSYRMRGQLILDDRHLTHVCAGANSIIPLTTIRDVSLAWYPRTLLQPTGVDILSVTYEEGGQRRQILLSPMEGWFGFPSDRNALTAEWFAALRDAVTSATGHVPTSTPREQVGIPRGSNLTLTLLLAGPWFALAVLWGCLMYIAMMRQMPGAPTTFPFNINPLGVVFAMLLLYGLFACGLPWLGQRRARNARRYAASPDALRSSPDSIAARPRFSRTAIVGACLVAMGLLSLFLSFFVDQMVTRPTAHEGMRSLHTPAEFLTKLQGRWEFRKRSKFLNDHLPVSEPGQAYAEIKGNVMAIWEQVADKRENEGLVLLKLGEPGPPQQVDLIVNPNGGADRYEPQGIIDVTDDKVQICIGIHRPEIIAVSSEAGIWELTRTSAKSSSPIPKRSLSSPPATAVPAMLGAMLVYAFFATLLGWISVTQIRRSAGKLDGLWLAVFDGLFFPLLALDALILAASGAVIWLLRQSSNIGPDPVWLVLSLIGLVVFTVAFAIAVDIFIVRAVWPVVSLPAGTSGTAPETPTNHSGLGTIGLVLAVISAVLGIAAVTTGAASSLATPLSFLAAELAILVALPARKGTLGKSALTIAATGLVVWPVVGLVVAHVRTSSIAQDAERLRAFEIHERENLAADLRDGIRSLPSLTSDGPDDAEFKVPSRHNQTPPLGAGFHPTHNGEQMTDPLAAVVDCELPRLRGEKQGTDVNRYIRGICVSQDGLVVIPVARKLLAENEPIKLGIWWPNEDVFTPGRGTARIEYSDDDHGLTLLKLDIPDQHNFPWVKCRSELPTPGQQLSVIRDLQQTQHVTVAQTGRSYPAGIEGQDGFLVESLYGAPSDPPNGSPILSGNDELQGIFLQATRRGGTSTSKDSHPNLPAVHVQKLLDAYRQATAEEHKTDLKVKVESLPTEPARLRVRHSDGSQTLFNSVVEAKVGFPNARLPNWCEYPTREGIVSLERLPVGTHWLVAGAEFSNRLPFQITIPTGQPLVERRLRAVSWSSSTPKFEIGREAAVELHDNEGEVIVVEILNQSTVPLNLSELDAELLSEFESESIRGLSPKWLMADREPVPRIQIEAGQTGRMRLNWREWARTGLWSSRNHEAMTEPGFSPSESGKVWVKAKLGSGSSLPVAVTDPKIMLAKELRRRDADQVLERATVDLVTGKRMANSVPDISGVWEYTTPEMGLKSAIGDRVEGPADNAAIRMWYRIRRAVDPNIDFLMDDVTAKPAAATRRVKWYADTNKFGVLGDDATAQPHSWLEPLGKDRLRFESDIDEIVRLRLAKAGLGKADDFDPVAEQLRSAVLVRVPQESEDKQSRRNLPAVD